MRALTTLAVIGLAVCMASTVAAQTPVTLSASRDNCLYEEPAGALGNGSGDHFFAGRNNVGGGGTARRGLVLFNVAAGVPAGAVILDAKLKLNMSQTSFGPVTVELHKVLAGWAEGATDAPGGEGSGAPRVDPEATWIHTSSPASLWAMPGGDFDPAVSASATVDVIALYSWNSPGMVTDVQNWLDNPAANFGWLLIGNEDTLATTKRFDSRTNPTVANRPELEVTYVMPTTVTLAATADNTLYEDPLGMVSNGRGDHFFSGRVGLGGGQIRHRAVLRFDVASGVPAGAIITSADLALFMSKTVIGPATIETHRLLENWGEGPSDAILEEGQGAPAAAGDATWIHTSFSSSMWSTVGGTFSAAPSAATPVDQIGVYHWTSGAMASDVQDMLDLPATDFGWLLLGDESVGSTSKRFSSRSNPTVANRPRLHVGYYIPSGGCLVLITGDVNVSGAVTSADIIVMVNHVFKGGPAPLPCAAAGDANCTGNLTSSDIITLVNFVFKGGPAPCDVCTIIPAQWSCP